MTGPSIYILLSITGRNFRITNHWTIFQMFWYKFGQVVWHQKKLLHPTPLKPLSSFSIFWLNKSKLWLVCDEIIWNSTTEGEVAINIKLSLTSKDLWYFKNIRFDDQSKYWSVLNSGDTLLWDNRWILGKPIIVLTRQAQPTHN